jgi:hypothetical protein
MTPALGLIKIFAAAKTCSNSFFGLPPWWKYIQPQPTPPDCNVTVKLPEGLWAIAFAVIDMLLYIAGIVAVISIIIAGIQYITSLGNTDSTTKARKRIQNSLIGLAIVLIAAPIVSFIGNKIG